jgi:hypothetical protein
MKKIMNTLRAYFKRVYRLSIGFEKQEKLVWKDLKRVHADEQWQSGVYENEKHIETVFTIAEKKPGTFHYMIYDRQNHCRVKVIDGFPADLTSDIFILAAHFNNLLNSGVVVVNVQGQFVEYHQKTDLLLPLLYQGEIYGQITRHYNTSKDIYWAYQRLLEEHEAPALIIADLLRSQDQKNEYDN